MQTPPGTSSELATSQRLTRFHFCNNFYELQTVIRYRSTLMGLGVSTVLDTRTTSQIMQVVRVQKVWQRIGELQFARTLRIKCRALLRVKRSPSPLFPLCLKNYSSRTCMALEACVSSSANSEQSKKLRWKVDWVNQRVVCEFWPLHEIGWRELL